MVKEPYDACDKFTSCGFRQEAFYSRVMVSPVIVPEPSHEERMGVM